MKKAVIYYQSKTGTTKAFAESISAYLNVQQVLNRCYDVNNYHESQISDADVVVMGGWTKGLMVILQHPDKAWTDFAKSIQLPENAKTALFTTFKIRTGSMFRKMKQAAGLEKSVPKLKSRDGSLTEQDKAVLCKLIA